MAAKKAATRRVAKDIEDTIENGAEQAFAGADAWTDAARDQYETALRAFNDSAEKFRAETEEAFMAAREGFDAVNERMQAVNADMMTAARAEITEAVEFANELARAKSIGDAFEIQRGYYTRLFETRAERLRAITEASADAARAAFEPMSKGYASAFSFAPSFPMAFDRFFPFSGK